MLPLLKRKNSAADAPTVPAWHPNFRDYEKLPDVKVVRTAFFVNGAAVLVLACLAIYFGLHEWQLRAVNAQIAVAQRHIDRDKRASDADVMLYRRFQAEQANVLAIEGFVASRPTLSGLLLHLGRTLPKPVALDGLEMRGDGVTLRLTVRGSPEVAAGYATAYFNQLQADPKLTEFDRKKFQFTNQARNPSTGNLAVEFFLPFLPKYVEKRR